MSVNIYKGPRHIQSSKKNEIRFIMFRSIKEACVMAAEQIKER